MTRRGQTFEPDLDHELLVTVSCLRKSADSWAARLFKDAGSPEPTPALLAWLAERLEMHEATRLEGIAGLREQARRALTDANRIGLTVLSSREAAYPPLLQHIVDPPIVLWVRGDPDALVAPAVAVVGARAATPAGLSVARRLGRDLAEAGLVVVSGLARGVDGAAHTGALEAAGRTVAVLGCGADLVYPREHAALAQRIGESGALVSEFLPGTPPLPPHFPLRNRIISGLVRAVVVIEASERSGSLITARAALEQGRDVLAVPGSVASGRYRGCHALIKDGARLVETVEDVLEELKWQRAGPSRMLTAVAGASSGRTNSLQSRELEETMAPGESYSLDELAHETGRPVASLLAELGTLELSGKVSRLPGGTFVRLDEPAMDIRRR